jgi:hypothetical protein
MEHDACYEKFGPDKMCDVKFLNQIRPLVNQPNNIGRDALIMYRVIRFKLLF